jgi:uncharacterized protein YqeY
MLKQRIEQDLKTALLAGDTTQVSVLRSLKSAITYTEVAKGVKDGAGLNDDQIAEVLAKESKKRQESADAFTKANESVRAAAELEEKSLIGRYLPAALSKEEIEILMQQVMDQIGAPTSQTMGRIIGAVKQQAGPMADGALIAQLVKERLVQ